MSCWCKTHLTLAILLGLAVFAQLPRTISVCHGADGVLRTGFGCQCPTCGDTAGPQSMERACGCGEVDCLGDAAGKIPTARLAANACCSGFQLPYQLALLHSNLLKPDTASQQLSSAPAWPPARLWAASVLSPAQFQLGQPPGPPLLRHLRTVILLA
jgi:hypothetical protein